MFRLSWRGIHEGLDHGPADNFAAETARTMHLTTSSFPPQVKSPKLWQHVLGVRCGPSSAKAYTALLLRAGSKVRRRQVCVTSRGCGQWREWREGKPPPGGKASRPTSPHVLDVSKTTVSDTLPARTVYGAAAKERRTSRPQKAARSQH